jgi:hypothetical protein
MLRHVAARLFRAAALKPEFGLAVDSAISSRFQVESTSGLRPPSYDVDRKLMMRCVPEDLFM